LFFQHDIYGPGSLYGLVFNVLN